MRVFTALIFTVLFATIGFAQRVKLNKGRPVSRSYFSQVTYREIQGKIVIPVEIEDKTYQFLFDTGAPNLITHELSQQISAKVLNRINVRDANDRSRKMEVVSIPLIGIGGVFFQDMPTLVNNPDSNFILDCFGVDGIIGSNMLRKSVVHLDSRKSLLSISNDLENFEIPIEFQNGLKLTLSDSQSSPYLWIVLEGEGKASEYVLFDTGMEGFYDMSVQNFEQLKALQVFDRTETGKGVKSIGLFDSSGTNTHYRVSLPKISIGNWDFTNVPTVTMDADRSRIGSELLDYGKVTLDYRNSKFYFEPYDNTRDLSEKALAFSPTIRDGEIIVGIVWEEGLSEYLSYGDRILNVNGIDISAMDPCEFINKPSPFLSDETFDIRFEDSETEKEYELRLTKK